MSSGFQMPPADPGPLDRQTTQSYSGWSCAQEASPRLATLFVILVISPQGGGGFWELLRPIVLC